MNINRVLVAAALATGLAASSVAAAQASVVATIDIANSNVSTTIYHAKNPPSRETDGLSAGLSWTAAPPDSIAAGAGAIMKVTLGANEFVRFTYGAPNLPAEFSNGCTMTVQANSLGSALNTPSVTPIGSGTSCSGVLVTGQPYNVKFTVSGF